MNGGRTGLIAVLCLVTALLTGCSKRTPEQVHQLESTLGHAVRALPVPVGSELEESKHTFDKGCQNLIECGSGGSGYAGYFVPVEPGPLKKLKAKKLCSSIIDLLAAHGLVAIGVRHDGPEIGVEEEDLFPAEGAPPTRWVTVDKGICRSGKVHQVAVVRSDGSSPAKDVNLDIEMTGAKGGKPAALTYSANQPVDNRSAPDRLPAHNKPLTVSEWAFLRGRLADQRIVLAAVPANDGIGDRPTHWNSNGDKSYQWYGQQTWTPTGKLTLRIRCTAGGTMRVATGRHKLEGPLDDKNAHSARCDGKSAAMALKTYAKTHLAMAYYGPASRDEPAKPTFLIEYLPR